MQASSLMIFVYVSLTSFDNNERLYKVVETLYEDLDEKMERTCFLFLIQFGLFKL